MVEYISKVALVGDFVFVIVIDYFVKQKSFADK